MLVERQTAEIATLRSRGATTARLLVQHGVEATLIASLAVLAGPPLAAAVISALGPTPAFSDLSGGEPLDVHISTLSFALAGAGALIAFFAFMVSAWQATRQTVVAFKRGAARPKRAPLFLRLYLDVALVVVLAIVFWRLRQQNELFEEPLFGEAQADPFLLTTPAVAMITAGVVFLRLFPLALRAIAWLVAQGRGVALLVGTRALARNPTHYSRLILMLMLATGVGMFGATFSATLDRSYEDRARYEVGADVRASDLRALARRGDGVFLDAIVDLPAEVASPVVRGAGVVAANGAQERVQVLGVEPDSFGEVAFFREDFSGDSFDAILAELATNGTSAAYVPLPEGARQLGAWVKLTDIRASMDVIAVLRDADGRLLTGFLGRVRPGDEATEQWRLFWMDLESPRSNFGRPLPVELRRPITMQALIVRTPSAIGAQRGVVLFGPVLTSPLPPDDLAPRGVPPPLASPFPGAVVAYDFTEPGFEVLQGVVGRRLDDQIRVDADAPPGFEAAIRYEWLEAQSGTRVRGLRQQIDGEPTLLCLSTEAAGRLGLAPGDAATLTVSGSHLEARYAGDFALFPTYDANDPHNGFVVVNASRLAVDANAALPTQTLAFNGVWFASADPAATRAAVAELAPQRLNDIDSERLRQEQDPLIAAGWEGILAISFAAVLILSAIGFLIYSYLTAQQRGLEFAVLRTLGFSRVQVFGVVLLEHLFVVLAGWAWARSWGCWWDG